MKKNIFLITFFVLITMIGFAQERTPRVNARQGAQQARIAQGQQSGELNRRETAGLRAEQRNIRRTERRAKADGNVTVVEKRRIEKKQNRANRHIRRAKHNGADTNPQ